ncbi:hypothetical protein I317_02223 [Kwoniella heveanensis CBS 569]|nr:hypothetical protein I317_02223 [Kwoniella heveanensis CBS 569]
MSTSQAGNSAPENQSEAFDQTTQAIPTIQDKWDSRVGTGQLTERGRVDRNTDLVSDFSRTMESAKANGGTQAGEVPQAGEVLNDLLRELSTELDSPHEAIPDRRASLSTVENPSTVPAGSVPSRGGGGSF